MEIGYPFGEGFWKGGGEGSWYGQGYHQLPYDFQATDWNKCLQNGQLIDDFDEPLYAVFPGTIVANYVDANGGIGVLLEDANGYRARYHHLSERSPLAVGSVVRVGGFVGRLGTTGLSNGPHLHFVVYGPDRISVPISFKDGPSLFDGVIVEVKAVAETPICEMTIEGFKIGGGFFHFFNEKEGVVGCGFPVSNAYRSPLMGNRVIQPFQRLVMVWQEGVPSPWDVTCILLDELMEIRNISFEKKTVWQLLKEESAKLAA